MNATDISLIFLGILIIMVLLEVRKLGRKPEPVSRLEEQFERLSQQMERIRPGDLDLPGGAQIVEAGRHFETISEQLERLGESADELDAAMLSEENVGRFLSGLSEFRKDLAAAQEYFESAARGLGQASDSMLSAGSALQRIDARMENVLVPAARTGQEKPASPGTARQGKAQKRVPPAPPKTPASRKTGEGPKAGEGPETPEGPEPSAGPETPEGPKTPPGEGR